MRIRAKHEDDPVREEFITSIGGGTNNFSPVDVPVQRDDW